MINIHEEYDKFVIKQDKYYLFCSIFSIFAVIFGIVFARNLFPLENTNTFIGVFPACFMILWEAVAVCGVFCNLNESSKRIIITKSGVLYRSCFAKKFYDWDDIKEWGLSYCGKERHKGNIYYFYFSKKISKPKNDCSIKLQGRNIKMYVFQEDYMALFDKVIPFCEKCTRVDPFIGKDKFHIL